MDRIILYTNHCPVCKMLRKELENSGLDFEVEDDYATMDNLGISNAPTLSVNGKLMRASDAFKYCKKHGENE